MHRDGGFDIYDSPLVVDVAGIDILPAARFEVFYGDVFDAAGIGVDAVAECDARNRNYRGEEKTKCFPPPPPWIVSVMFFIAFSLLFGLMAFRFCGYYTILTG